MTARKDRYISNHVASAIIHFLIEDESASKEEILDLCQMVVRIDQAATESDLEFEPPRVFCESDYVAPVGVSRVQSARWLIDMVTKCKDVLVGEEERKEVIEEFLGWMNSQDVEKVRQSREYAKTVPDDGIETYFA